MARPQIIANGGSAGVKASVSAGGAITLTLDSIVGVRSVQWSVLSTDETTATTDYTLVQSGSVGQTATTTALTAGTAVLFKVKINSGLVRGLLDLDNTTNTIKVFVPTAEGLEVGAAGETFESDATTGTTEILNAPIRVLNTFTTSLYETDLKRAIASAIANVALTGDPSPMDGVTVETGQVVFLAGQTSAIENGLWEVNTSGAWSRPDNFTTSDAVKGCVIAVIDGTLRKGYFYRNTNVGAVGVPEIGADNLTFTRLPDQFDRDDLANSSSTPGVSLLTRYGSGMQLNGAYFSSSGANPATSGLLRAIKNTVAVAFRDDANGANLEALSMDATDVLRVGSALVDKVMLSVKSAGEVRMLANAVAFVKHALTGMIFGRTATMSITQEAAPGGAAGTDATIEAQAGDGAAGGKLVLKSGTGTTPGNVELDARATATASGRISFKGGAFGEFIGMAYDNSTSTATIEITADITVFDTKELILPATNVTFFASAGSYGGGSKVVFIENASTTPGSDPTGGGILYCEGGALKFRGSAGTVSTVAPA